MFYLDLFQALERHHVRYLLVGGLAINIHGVERATMDVDLSLALDNTNLQNFIVAAESLNLKPVIPVPLVDLLDAKIREEWIHQRNMIAFALRPPASTAPTIDLVLKSSLDFETAYGRRIEKNLGSTMLSLAGMDDLITMKTGTGREQDESDIAALYRLRELGLS